MLFFYQTVLEFKLTLEFLSVFLMLFLFLLQLRDFFLKALEDFVCVLIVATLSLVNTFELLLKAFVVFVSVRMNLTTDKVI